MSLSPRRPTPAPSWQPIEPRLHRDYQIELDQASRRLPGSTGKDVDFPIHVRRTIERLQACARLIPPEQIARRLQLMAGGLIVLATSIGLLVFATLHPVDRTVPGSSAPEGAGAARRGLGADHYPRPLDKTQLARTADRGVRLLELGISGAIWSTPESERAFRDFLCIWPGPRPDPATASKPATGPYPLPDARRDHLVTGLANRLLGY